MDGSILHHYDHGSPVTPQVLPPASDSINFVHFVDALRLVSTKLRVSLNRVVEAIVLVGAPVE